MIRRLLTACLGSLLLTACATTSGTATGVHPRTVTVGIVAINDFHGALEPPKQSVPITGADGKVVPVPAGGAAYVASVVDSIRTKYANTLTVSAGDLVGGSSLVSSLYLDEPAVEAMNRIGLEYNAVGNHEFDAGRDELLRKQNGGCLQHTARKPCQVEAFAGARFKFLAANAQYADGHTLFPATAIKRFGNGRRRVAVGLIGLTLQGTGELVQQSGLGGLHFADEAETINALVPKLKAQGADAIVLLIHQGAYTSGAPDPQGCNDIHGSIMTILPKLDPRVDVVVSGHTHWSYVCDFVKTDPVHPLLMTSAGVFGELVTDISLEIDPATHRVVGRSARNVIVQSEAYGNARGNIALTDLAPHFMPRADIAGYVAKYVAASHEFINRPAGQLAGPVNRPLGDSSRYAGTLGLLIADAQLAATTGAGAQIALMNPFGVRAPHLLSPAADGSITFGQIYAVQPFNNDLVTKSFTGAQLKEVLEQNFTGNDPISVLAPSQGFSYSFDLSRPGGDRITAMTLNGKPIQPDASYRVTTNSFLSGGGDSYSVFTKGTDPVIGMTDIAALEAWLKAVPPRAVPEDNRTIDQSPTPMSAKP